jgi:hypothetical protein
MLVKRLIATLGAICALATPAVAQTTYTCSLKEAGRSNWIPPVLFIGHDPAANRVVVSDPIVLHFNDRQPVEGKVDTENDKRVTFVWELKTRDTRGQSATMIYRATWVKADKRMNITATALGYESGIQGFGTCEVEMR